MIRATAVAVAILFAPALAEAQRVDASERTHTVQSGETLGSIARDHLGAATEWRVIYEANRDRIEDPDRIAVGTTLVIPGTDAAADGAARVTAVEVAGPEQPRQDLVSYEARRELLEARSFEPSGIPELPEAERTVFFDLPSAAEGEVRVVIQPPELVPAVPEGVFRSAGWLILPGNEEQPLGRVLSLSVDEVTGPGRTSVQLYERVRIGFDAEGAPQVGDEFLVYRLSPEVEEIGRIAAPTGRIRVIQGGEGEAVAQVVREYGQLAVGDRLTRPRTFPLEVGVHPTETDARIEGRILAFQDAKELYLPGDYAFVDIGSDEGLEIGDELIGVAEDGDDWTGRELAAFQVVGVREGHSTIRISQVVTPGPVRPGLRVVVVRQMP